MTGLIREGSWWRATSILTIIVVAVGAGIVIDILAEGSQTKPDLKVTVVSFEPEGDTDPATNITVRFSRHMAATDLLDQTLTEYPLEFDPPLVGIARWIEKDVLRFYPDHGLAPATEYTVRVRSKESFLYGNKIREDRKFEFHTPEFKVNRVVKYPEFDAKTPGLVRLSIDLYFNYEIEVDQLRELVTIKGKDGATKSELSFEIAEHAVEPGALIGPVGPGLASRVGLLTEPFEISLDLQTYILTIDKDLKCFGCDGSLDEDYTKLLVVQARRRQFIEAANGRIVGQTGSIEIRCNQVLTLEDAEDYITVDPEIRFRVEQAHSRFNLVGDFLPGEVYTVTVAEGLPAQDGAVLEREFSSKVVIPDLPPSLKFSSQGIYMPRGGSRLLKLETVNVAKVSLEASQVFANNIVYALASDIQSRYGGQRNMSLVGRKLHTLTKELAGKHNEPLTTTVDVGAIVGFTSRGIFLLSARKYEDRWNQDSRMVMITDIGIMARYSDNYLMVWTNSLTDTKPIVGATVSLMSKNNQALVSGQTDSRGIVVFNDINDKIEGFEPFLITVEKDTDLAYLKFAECLLPTSDFDVTGRPYLESGYEAFLYLDRGVFRPGETAHIVSIVRGPDGSVPDAFPYFLIIKDPTGREFKSVRLSTSEEAFTSVDLDIPGFASTGKYSMTARIGEDYVIGQGSFQVEEFMPDRIKVTVSTAQKSYTTGETLPIKVVGKYFFGPPAAKHKVTGHITLEEHNFSPPGFGDYSFSHRERSFAKAEVDLKDTLLDENGEHTYLHPIPESIRPPSALKCLITGGVSEQGGRAVHSYTEVTVHPYNDYLGLRMNFKGYAKPGEPCEASLIAVDTKGRASAVDLVDVRFYRMVYHTVRKNDGRGFYRYVSERTPTLIDSAMVSVTVDGASVSFVPPEYGQYMIVASDKRGGHATSRYFYASGWGYAPWSLERPGRVEIDLDKSIYKPGDVAQIQIRAPFSGKLLVTIEKDRVYDFITYDLEENTAEISITVNRDYFPNAYITATVIKRAGDVDGTSPARAFGIAPLKVTDAKKELQVSMTTPEAVKPNTEVQVEVDVGVRGRTLLTVAAIDAGILSLTDFQTPDPKSFFHGQKRPRLQPYDIYAFIYPEAEQAESHLSPAGGKMFAESRKRHLNPISARRVKSVALWSGIVTTNDSGKATISLAIPQFNGQLTVMAVAAQRDRFGASTSEIIVRDKIVIQESFPRFTTTNDVVEGLVTIFNNTGAPADIAVTLDADGPIEIKSASTQTISLADNSEGTVVFNLATDINPGKMTFKLTAVAGVESSEVDFELANRPGQPLATRWGLGTIREAEAAHFGLPDDWIASTSQTVMRTSSLAAVTYAKNINYLVKYPYGCLEQTTSALFPLLYFNDLARFVQPEVFGTKGADYFVQEGIIKLNGFIQSPGWFSFWPASRIRNDWSSIYASHFLLEARKAGFQVDKKLHNDIVKNLKNLARGQGRDNRNSTWDDREQIYAAYALAQAGITDKGATNQLRKIPLDKLPDFSKYQLAGVLAMAGDMEGAKELLPETIMPAVYEPETGGRFDSGVRTNAILLDVLMTIDPNDPSCAVVAESLAEDAKVGRWYNTQATAWALMVLGKYLKGQAVPDFVGTLAIDGDTTCSFGTEDFKLVRDGLVGNDVDMSIDGEGLCFYYWVSSGVPVSNAPDEFERGIKVTRTYMTADGDSLDLHDVALGTQVICHVKAEAVDKSLSNVVINDLLPAGLEIENPRLKTTPRLSWLPKASLGIDHQDIRDDRLLLFVTLQPGHPVNFYYSLRAISAGEFKIPPVAAECMYNPWIAGASSSGVLIVRGSH